MAANRKCIYLTEGECEEKLINALKVKPSLILPGKVKKFNVIQEEIPASILMSFDPGSMVVLVFDTDNEVTGHLKKNIAALNKRCARVEVLTIAQVLNFEDEIERSTDVAQAQDLTKSATVSDFKRAVNRMKDQEFREAGKILEVLPAKFCRQHDFRIWWVVYKIAGYQYCIAVLGYFVKLSVGFISFK